MPLPQIPTPYIKFHFEGVVALCVAQGRPKFEAAIIKSLEGDGEVREHIFSIQFTKLKNGQPVGQPLIFNKDNPVKVLRLEIQNSSPKGAQLFRPDGSDVEDLLMHFDWAVGVEGKRMHKKKVEIETNALRTVLRVFGVDESIFYTAKMSPADLKTEDNKGNPRGRIKGAAEIIEAIVSLPSGKAPLEKLNEATGAFDPAGFTFVHEPDVVYEVNVSQVCIHSGDCFPQNVADCYNNLIIGDEDRRKISFVVDENGGSPKTAQAPRKGLLGKIVDIARGSSKPTDVSVRISPQTQCIIENFEKTQGFENPA